MPDAPKDYRFHCVYCYRVVFLNVQTMHARNARQHIILNKFKFYFKAFQDRGFGDTRMG